MVHGNKHFFEAYVTCALWSSSDESDESGGEPLDCNYDDSDIAQSTLSEMATDCARFQTDNAALLEDYYAEIPLGRDGNGEWTPEAQAGHDFWLSRNGHGAGFFDRDVPRKLRDTLQKAAREFGSFDLYVGDDGKIYIFNRISN